MSIANSTYAWQFLSALYEKPMSLLLVIVALLAIAFGSCWIMFSLLPSWLSTILFIGYMSMLGGKLGEAASWRFPTVGQEVWTLAGSVIFIVAAAFLAPKFRRLVVRTETSWAAPRGS